MGQLGRCGRCALVVSFLVVGTLTTMLGKIMFQTYVPFSAAGEVRLFKKPWFRVWAMFFAMFLCGPILGIQRAVFQRRDGGAKVTVLVSGKPLWKVSLFICVPALCDLLATVLQGVSLLFTNVSIWQMFRGSTCVFSAALRWFYAGKRTMRHEIVGILLVVVGLVLVGYASIASPSSTGAQDKTEVSTMLKLVGILCILVAQCIQAFQCVVEEGLLHDVQVNTLYIVFVEGFWGLLLSSTIFMPAAQLLPGDDGDGVHEQIWPEELYALTHSSSLQIITFLYVTVIIFYNIIGLTITAETEATTRNVVDAGRTLVVWILALCMNFIDPQYGEAIGWFTFIEFAGFTVLMLGMFVYKGTIPLPSLLVEEENSFPGNAQEALIAAD